MRQIVENLQYIYGMELIHACQVIDLRQKKSAFKLGKGTEIVLKEFRKNVRFYENDRPEIPFITSCFYDKLRIKNNVLWHGYLKK